MLSRKFPLDFHICILFPIALSVLLTFVTFRILITVNNGKSTWRNDGDELIHIFECNHEEADTRMLFMGT